MEEEGGGGGGASFPSVIWTSTSLPLYYAMVDIFFSLSVFSQNNAVLLG